MRYSSEILQEYGITLSIISEATSTPKLQIGSSDGYSTFVIISRETTQGGLLNNDIFDKYIEQHIKSHKKHLRNQKLKKLNEK